MKTCTMCKEQLPEDNFYKSGSKLRSECKSCNWIMRREYEHAKRREYFINDIQFRLRMYYNVYYTNRIKKSICDPQWTEQVYLVYHRKRVYLGYDSRKAVNYIESLFLPGMTWSNRGKWHIDHIIPVSKFDLTKHDDVISCWSLANIQPLWARDNILKGNISPVTSL